MVVPAGIVRPNDQVMRNILVGETVVGAAGTEGADVRGVTILPSLHALEPKLLDAFTYHA